MVKNRQKIFSIMKISAFLCVSLLVAAAECQKWTEFFVEPRGCAADVLVAADYRRAFHEKHRAAPTYERVREIFDKAFPHESSFAYGDAAETIVTCGGEGGPQADENWARQSVDCARKLKAEMNAVIDALASRTAAELNSMLNEYARRSVELLRAYGDEPPDRDTAVANRSKPPFELLRAFELQFGANTETALSCALRFLFDAAADTADAAAGYAGIYRKYALFAAAAEDDDGGKRSMSAGELLAKAEALRAAEGPDWEDRLRASESETNESDDPVAREGGRLRALEARLVAVAEPFCAKKNNWKQSALRWSFLKKWPHYHEGFFMKKSLAKHPAILGGKPISLEMIFEHHDFDDPFDEIMAINELVPFVLHNYVANVIVYFIPLTIEANNRLFAFVSDEKLQILQNATAASKTQKGKKQKEPSPAALVAKQFAKYKYFGRLFDVFKTVYELYCEVMGHDPAPVKRLLNHISDNYRWEEHEFQRLPANVGRLKWMLSKLFRWPDEIIANVDTLNISIEGLVDTMERISYRFLSLTELITESKIV